MIELIISCILLYIAYRLFVTMPVKRDMDRQREAVESDKRIADAHREDHDNIHFKF